jgi:hypothetical protein
VVHKFGGVQLQLLQLGFGSWFLVYGLSVLVFYSWRKRDMLSLGYLMGLALLPKLLYMSRLWCLGVDVCLRLGDNIEILSMEKRARLF